MPGLDCLARPDFTAWPAPADLPFKLGGCPVFKLLLFLYCTVFAGLDRLVSDLSALPAAAEVATKLDVLHCAIAINCTQSTAPSHIN
jgi:hypothetical protein